MIVTAPILTDDQTARLERLRLYGTRYEVSAEKDGALVLVGYTGRKSRRGLLEMLQQNGEKWCAFSGATEAVFGPRKVCWMMSAGWKIQFSGRTQRDCIMHGEAPFFPDLLEAAA